jgi:hypothetical protein
MNMPSNKDIKSLVQPILQSRDFKDSPIYSKLLSYLVESALSRKIPKEITIAIDVFGKDSSFNSNKDSTVRYHILILRGKLENYYKNEGKDDKVRLVIPKGHYGIQFTPSKIQYFKSLTYFLSFLRRWEFAVIVLLLILNFYILYHHQPRASRIDPPAQTPNYIDPKDKFWSSFFDNGYPVDIVLGDDFMMDEYSLEYKRYRQVQDWEIKSENDMSDFLIHHPKANLWKSEITGIPYGGADNLMDILRIVYHFQNDVSLLMSSSLAIEEIRDHNIIYIGELVNLRILNKIFFKTPIRYQYRPDERLFVLDKNGDTLKTYQRLQAAYEQKNKYNVDYSLLIKMPGFSRENFMFIVGFGYGGRLERTKMLANSLLREKFVKNICKLNKTMPEYFIVLFKVKGIERTGFTDEIEYFKEIPQNFYSD